MAACLKVERKLIHVANEAKACSNLGTVYQLMSDFDGALKLHWTHLQVAKELRDASAMGTAYANIGACYSSLNKFDEAFKYTSFMLASGNKKAKSICSTWSQSIQLFTF